MTNHSVFFLNVKLFICFIFKIAEYKNIKDLKIQFSYRVRFTVAFRVKVTTTPHLQANEHKEYHRAGPSGVYGDEVPGGA